jgi:hypothetical protein
MTLDAAPPHLDRFRLAAVTLVVAVVTVLAVMVPLWLMLSWLFVAIDLGGHPTWISVGLGVTMMAALLALPAAAWGATVAYVVGVDGAPVVRRAIRTGVLTAIPVGIGIDLSQLFIDMVWTWGRLAVHTLFALAFAGGLAVFLGVVTSRVLRIVVAQDADVRAPPGVSGAVALATALGVALGAAAAIPMDWVVVPFMGRRMLLPLYLVVATGMATGGATFGWHLARIGRVRP